MQSPMMSMAEAAAALGVNVTTVYDYARAGFFPNQRKGKNGYLIHRAEFEKWMKEGRTPHQPETPAQANDQTISIDAANGTTIEITIAVKPQRTDVRPLPFARIR